MWDLKLLCVVLLLRDVCVCCCDVWIDEDVCDVVGVFVEFDVMLLMLCVMEVSVVLEMFYVCELLCEVCVKIELFEWWLMMLE